MPSFPFLMWGCLFSFSLITYLHYDPSIKDTIRRAVFEHLCEPTRDDYKSVVSQLIASKAPPQKNQKDVDELIEKTVTTRKVRTSSCLVQVIQFT